VQHTGCLAAPNERFSDWAQKAGVEWGPIPDLEKEHMIAELDAVAARPYGLTKRPLVRIFETFHEGWDYETRLRAVLRHPKEWAARSRPATMRDRARGHHVEHADELARQQKIRHIMTPIERVEWADAAAPCRVERRRFADLGFSYAPMRWNGCDGLVSVRQLPDSETPVGEADTEFLPRELHADDELRYAPEWFASQDAYLVREYTPVVGLVHLSDLNRLAFRACVYHQITALEQAMLRHIERARPDAARWGELLTQKRLKRVQGQWERSRKHDTDLSVIMELYVDDLVDLCAPELGAALACKAEAYRACVTEPVKWLRNRVCHIGKPVVTGRRDIQRVAETLAMVRNMRAALN